MGQKVTKHLNKGINKLTTEKFKNFSVKISKKDANKFRILHQKFPQIRDYSQENLKLHLLILNNLYILPKKQLVTRIKTKFKYNRK